jgi:protein ImuA
MNIRLAPWIGRAVFRKGLSMTKAALLAQLRAEVSALEGHPERLDSGHSSDSLWCFGSSVLDQNLSGGLSLAAVHELAPDEPAHWASAVAVAVRLLLRLPPTRDQRPLLWVQNRRTVAERGRLSAASLAAAGLALERLIFLEVSKPAEALWALEEGLQTPSLAAVVAAGVEIGFTASRRLSLACSASAVPLLHLPERASATTAAATRWQVSPRPSAPDLLVSQAVGRSRWHLRLVRARQEGAMRWPASYDVEWDDATLCFDLVAPLAPRSVEAPASRIARAA